MGGITHVNGNARRCTKFRNDSGTVLERHKATIVAILKHMSNPRILIVDDEPKVAFFFQKNLEFSESGYIVNAVNSGPEALEELKKERYDLLITDLRMPKMNGLELLRHVRQVSPETQTILLTAYGTDAVWEEAKQLETFRALSKPLKIAELLTAVREALTQPSSKKAAKRERTELLVLTGEHFELLSSRIEELRIDVGARVVVMADTSGSILTFTGSNEELNLSEMMALLGGIMAASSELAGRLDYSEPVHLSYFEGPPYDLYAASISENLFLTIIYDRRKGLAAASRIGLVWLYTHRSLGELQKLLGQQASEVQEQGVSPLAEGFVQSLKGELDSMFGEDEDVTAVTANNLAEKRVAPKTKPLLTNTAYTKIDRIVTRFAEQTNLKVEAHLSALDAALPASVNRLAITAVIAGLKNIHQHSQATVVGVSFTMGDGHLQGRITDNGIGFVKNVPPMMHSLATLQKEFEKAGGELTLSGRFNYGGILAFHLPIIPKEDSSRAY